MRLIIATCVALLMGATAWPVRAATGPVIDWDPAYAWQTGATVYNMPAGGEFHMVGTISMFGPPLDFLNASLPGTEYTFYCHGLISQGTTAIGPPATTLYTALFSGGQIEIYADNSPDAAFDPNPPSATVPATFTDGDPILTGVFSSFTVNSNNFSRFNVGDIQGDILWTGGSLLPQIPGGSSNECPGLLTGGSTWYPPVMIDGYLFRHDGKIDLQCPTPTRGSTWGRIKSLYR